MKEKIKYLTQLLFYAVTRICAIEKALHDQWQKVMQGLSCIYSSSERIRVLL
jgi:hypothetical protein